MEFDPEEELKKFRNFKNCHFIDASICELAPDIFAYLPYKKDTSIKVGFLAIVHGNEVIGLPILNSILEQLQLSGQNIEIYFGLGNVPAYIENKRFIEKDLNRCFGQMDSQTLEDRRAREIESCLLTQIDLLIDLHQTIEPSLSPFFIFQYAKPECLKHLSLMNKNLPAVLQFESIGESQEGLSTDEFLRTLNKFGTALELGEKGFSDRYYHLGRNICFDYLTNLCLFQNFFDIQNSETSLSVNVPLYSIDYRALTEDCSGTLFPDFYNLQPIAAAQAIGLYENGSTISAKHDGALLFPHTTKTVEAGNTLYYHCRKVSVQDVVLKIGI